MSTSGPLGPSDPFGPFGGGAGDDDGDGDGFGDLSFLFGDFLQSMSGQGAAGVNWESAKQMAAAIATGPTSEPNVDPIVRISIEQLARVAELQVTSVTGLDLGPAAVIEPVTRQAWTATTLDAYRPLFEQLITSLGAVMREQLEGLDTSDIEEMTEVLPPGLAGDPATFLNGLRQMMGPMMLSMMAGSTVGQLGTRAFGNYDLPIPRTGPARLSIVSANLDQFGSDWSLPSDDLRLWVCLHEMSHHAVLSIPHVGGRISELLSSHAGSFSSDLGAIEERLGDLDLGSPEGMAKLTETMGNPEVVLGAIRSDRQRELLPYLDAIVMAVEGYVDWVLDTIGGRLLSSYPMVTESLRRRRVETDQASRFVERLFGLELTQEKFDRGNAFVAGIVDRAGTDALAQLWNDPSHLPTPNEIEAPGIWLARIGIDAADQELPDVGDFEIPDFPDLEN